MSGNLTRPSLRRRRAAGAAALAGALVALSACGGGGDPSDALVEGIIERGAPEGVDVQVDTDSGSFSVTDDTGTFTVGSGELPEELPEELVPPGDPVVEGAYFAGDGDNFNTGATFYPEGVSFEDLVAYYERTLEAMGLGEVRRIESSGDEGRTVNFVVEGDGRGANVAVDETSGRLTVIVFYYGTNG